LGAAVGGGGGGAVAQVRELCARWLEAGYLVNT